MTQWRRLRMPLLKKDDGLLEVVHRLLATAGIAFGAWAYFHTVHPVFTKEEELLDAKGDLQQAVTQLRTTQAELDARQALLDSLAVEVAAKQQQLMALSQTLGALRTDLAVVQARANELMGNVMRERSEAARANVMRLVDRVAREAIDAEIRSSADDGVHFDLQRRCLELSEEVMASTTSSEAEQRASRVLAAFANRRLRPGTTGYDGLFEIFVYMVVDEEAKALLVQPVRTSK